MKTPTTKASDIERSWHLIDLKGKTLGRVASEIAQLLQGKDKVYYSPNLDAGDYVVAINSDDTQVSTKKKLENKIYYTHSGYAGGFKQTTLKEKMDKDSREVIKLAVKNMLPKNKMRKPRLARFKIFKDDKHPHQSQINSSK